jgi:cell division protease FtsH
MDSRQGANGDDTPSAVSSRRWPHAWWSALIVGLLAINFWAGSRAMDGESRVRVPYSPYFLEQVRAGNVAEITSSGTAIQGTLRAPRRFEDLEPTTRFETEIPAFADTAALSRLLQRVGVVQNARPLDDGTSWWTTLLVGFGPTLLLVGFFVWLGRRSSRVSALGSFGRSSARRYAPASNGVTFADVAGTDEAKQELTDVVDFLRNPAKYTRLGSRVPRGVLLAGPPGTGKTLLARALAGEANVPFFSMAASEFVEAIVGVGAARVRDLFKQAKAEAPAIVFIDELDAVGRSRSSVYPGFSGGNDEREQTLNQILTEMDGFDSSIQVIVLGATNRPEVLDPALLRPGRFDRRVAVQPPDRDGRRQILGVHTRRVPLAADVDLDVIAASTPGMVGADLANLVNEASLLAARRNQTQVTNADFSDALEKIVLGSERKVLMTAADRRRTAYHEGGHALVGMLTEGADPVRKVSIIPRGQTLGATFSAPSVDRYGYSDRELRARIDVALGGRIAEEIVFGDVTTGAESDIQQLTQIARQMIGRWGMSAAVGPIAVIPPAGQPSLGDVSAETQRLVDEEVRTLVATAHDDVTRLLTRHRRQLDRLAAALLERETLDQQAAYEAADVRTQHPSVAARDAVAALAAVPDFGSKAGG